ncbi:hypothetical protein HDU96_010750 [Phlyctochytrium bullatum]|nr:hypothetical protein HDU96_010750 [Phlyctochytrium bullatum]
MDPSSSSSSSSNAATTTNPTAARPAPPPSTAATALHAAIAAALASTSAAAAAAASVLPTTTTEHDATGSTGGGGGTGGDVAGGAASAANRPHHTGGKQYLYPAPLKKRPFPSAAGSVGGKAPSVAAPPPVVETPPPPPPVLEEKRPLFGGKTLEAIIQHQLAGHLARTAAAAAAVSSGTTAATPTAPKFSTAAADKPKHHPYLRTAGKTPSASTSSSSATALANYMADIPSPVAPPPSSSTPTATAGAPPAPLKPRKSGRRSGIHVATPDDPYILSHKGYEVEVHHQEDARDKVLMAIVTALLEMDNRPSTPRELTACIMRHEFTHLGGLTPHATVSSRISTHYKRCTMAEEAGETRQVLLGRRQYGDGNNPRKLRYYINQLPTTEDSTPVPTFNPATYKPPVPQPRAPGTSQKAPAPQLRRKNSTGSSVAAVAPADPYAVVWPDSPAASKPPKKHQHQGGLQLAPPSGIVYPPGYYDDGEESGGSDMGMGMGGGRDAAPSSSPPPPPAPRPKHGGGKQPTRQLMSLYGVEPSSSTRPSKGGKGKQPGRSKTFRPPAAAAAAGSTSSDDSETESSEEEEEEENEAATAAAAAAAAMAAVMARKGKGKGKGRVRVPAVEVEMEEESEEEVLEAGFVAPAAVNPREGARAQAAVGGKKFTRPVMGSSTSTKPGKVKHKHRGKEEVPPPPPPEVKRKMKGKDKKKMKMKPKQRAPPPLPPPAKREGSPVSEDEGGSDTSSSSLTSMSSTSSSGSSNVALREAAAAKPLARRGSTTTTTTTKQRKKQEEERARRRRAEEEERERERERVRQQRMQVDEASSSEEDSSEEEEGEIHEEEEEEDEDEEEEVLAEGNASPVEESSDSDASDASDEPPPPPPKSRKRSRHHSPKQPPPPPQQQPAHHHQPVFVPASSTTAPPHGSALLSTATSPFLPANLVASPWLSAIPSAHLTAQQRVAHASPNLRTATGGAGGGLMPSRMLLPSPVLGPGPSPRGLTGMSPSILGLPSSLAMPPSMYPLELEPAAIGYPVVGSVVGGSSAQVLGDAGASHPDAPGGTATGNTGVGASGAATGGPGGRGLVVPTLTFERPGDPLHPERMSVGELDRLLKDAERGEATTPPSSSPPDPHGDHLQPHSHHNRRPSISGDRKRKRNPVPVVGGGGPGVQAVPPVPPVGGSTGVDAEKEKKKRKVSFSSKQYHAHKKHAREREGGGGEMASPRLSGMEVDVVKREDVAMADVGGGGGGGEPPSAATVGLWRRAAVVARSYKRGGPVFELLEVREPRNAGMSAVKQEEPEPQPQQQGVVSPTTTGRRGDWTLTRIRSAPVVTLTLRTAVVTRSASTCMVTEMPHRSGSSGSDVVTLGIDVRGHVRASELLEIVDALGGGEQQGRGGSEEPGGGSRSKPSFLSGCMAEIRRQVQAIEVPAVTGVAAGGGAAAGEERKKSISAVASPTESQSQGGFSSAASAVSGESNEEVDAAISLLGLVSANSTKTEAGEGDAAAAAAGGGAGGSGGGGLHLAEQKRGQSFALRIIADVTFANAREELVVVVLRSGNTVPPECEGVWIPIEIARRIAGKHTSVPLVASLFGFQIEKRTMPQSISLLPPPPQTPSVTRGKRRGSTTTTEKEGYLIFESDGEEDEEMPDLMSQDQQLAAPAGQSAADSLPVSIDHTELFLIPSMVAMPESTGQIWMTTIEGVYVYITWVQEPAASAASVPPTTTGIDEPGRGVPILRRVDNDMVNATLLLHAGGLSTDREKSIVLSLERSRVRNRREGSALFGTWIPLSRAREIARSLCLNPRLETFLDDGLGPTFFNLESRGGRRRRKGGLLVPSPGLALGMPLDPTAAELLPGASTSQPIVDIAAPNAPVPALPPPTTPTPLPLPVSPQAAVVATPQPQKPDIATNAKALVSALLPTILAAQQKNSQQAATPGLVAAAGQAPVAAPPVLGAAVLPKVASALTPPTPSVQRPKAEGGTALTTLLATLMKNQGQAPKAGTKPAQPLAQASVPVALAKPGPNVSAAASASKTLSAQAKTDINPLLSSLLTKLSASKTGSGTANVDVAGSVKTDAGKPATNRAPSLSALPLGTNAAASAAASKSTTAQGTLAAIMSRLKAAGTNTGPSPAVNTIQINGAVSAAASKPAPPTSNTATLPGAALQAAAALATPGPKQPAKVASSSVSPFLSSGKVPNASGTPPPAAGGAAANLLQALLGTLRAAGAPKPPAKAPLVAVKTSPPSQPFPGKPALTDAFGAGEPQLSDFPDTQRIGSPALAAHGILPVIPSTPAEVEHAFSLNAESSEPSETRPLSSTLPSGPAATDGTAGSAATSIPPLTSEPVAEALNWMADATASGTGVSTDPVDPGKPIEVRMEEGSQAFEVSFGQSSVVKAEDGDLGTAASVGIEMKGEEDIVSRAPLSSSDGLAGLDAPMAFSTSANDSNDDLASLMDPVSLQINGISQVLEDLPKASSELQPLTDNDTEGSREIPVDMLKNMGSERDSSSLEAAAVHYSDMDGPNTLAQADALGPQPCYAQSALEDDDDDEIIDIEN